MIKYENKIHQNREFSERDSLIRNCKTMHINKKTWLQSLFFAESLEVAALQNRNSQTSFRDCTYTGRGKQSWATNYISKNSSESNKLFDFNEARGKDESLVKLQLSSIISEESPNWPFSNRSRSSFSIFTSGRYGSNLR